MNNTASGFLSSAKQNVGFLMVRGSGSKVRWKLEPLPEMRSYAGHLRSGPYLELQHGGD